VYVSSISTRSCALYCANNRDQPPCLLPTCPSSFSHSTPSQRNQHRFDGKSARRSLRTFFPSDTFPVVYSCLWARTGFHCWAYSRYTSTNPSRQFLRAVRGRSLRNLIRDAKHQLSILHPVFCPPKCPNRARGSTSILRTEPVPILVLREH
jgi:hypothetical protein